jgi:hypothetical protein
MKYGGTEHSVVNHLVASSIDSPTPRINLSTSEDVRREMARVYREARNKTLAANEATKLVYMLTQILRATEVYLLEKRLLELELAHLKTVS